MRNTLLVRLRQSGGNSEKEQADEWKKSGYLAYAGHIGGRTEKFCMRNDAAAYGGNCGGGTGTDSH